MTAMRLARAATGREPRAEVRRRLPRPRRRPARAGRLGSRHAGDPGEPGRARQRGGRDGDRPLERPRRARARPPTRHEFAAILAEPMPANMGARAAQRRASWSCCASAPTPTARCSIFDEVITGFRVARGGAAGAAAACCPTSTIMGKIIGGGLPAGALGGSASADGAARAGRRRLPGRERCRATRSRSPPAWPRSHRLDDARVRPAGGTTTASWPTACAKPPASAGRVTSRAVRPAC